MSIESSYTQADAHTQEDGRRYVTHYFTDHLGKVSKRGPIKIPGSDTETEYAAYRTAQEQTILAQLAEQEIQAAVSRAERGLTIDTVPNHQTQAEFDRRVLGRLMLIDNIYTFQNAAPFFLAVKNRGGNNNGQRANYLGITVADYNLIDARFTNAESASFFVSTDKNSIWDELPDVFL